MTQDDHADDRVPHKNSIPPELLLYQRFRPLPDELKESIHVPVATIQTVEAAGLVVEKTGKKSEFVEQVIHDEETLSIAYIHRILKPL